MFKTIPIMGTKLIKKVESFLNPRGCKRLDKILKSVEPPTHKTQEEMGKDVEKIKKQLLELLLGYLESIKKEDGLNMLETIIESENVTEDIVKLYGWCEAWWFQELLTQLTCLEHELKS